MPERWLCLVVDGGFGDQDGVFGGDAEHCLAGRALVGQIAIGGVI